LTFLLFSVLQIPIDVLQDCFGTTIDVKHLLTTGPVVLKFFRGTWCAFCSADLHFLQENLGLLQGLGASVIAVSTQLKETSVDAYKALGLSFHLVSDADLTVANKFGLLFHLTDDIARSYEEAYGTNLQKYYNKGDLDMTMPATFVIDRTGTVAYAFIDEDFRKRASIDEVAYHVKKANIDKM